MLSGKKLVTAMMAVALIGGGSAFAEEEAFLPEEEDSSVGIAALAPNSISSCSFSPRNVNVGPGDPAPSVTFTYGQVDPTEASPKLWGELYLDGELVEASSGDAEGEVDFLPEWSEDFAGAQIVIEMFGVNVTNTKEGALLCRLVVTYEGLGGGGSSPVGFESIGLSLDTHEGALAENKQISITGEKQLSHGDYLLELECSSGTVTLAHGFAGISGNYSGLYKLPAMDQGFCTLSLTSTGAEGSTYRLAMQLVVDAEGRLAHIGTPAGSITAN